MSMDVKITPSCDSKEVVIVLTDIMKSTSSIKSCICVNCSLPFTIVVYNTNKIEPVNEFQESLFKIFNLTHLKDGIVRPESWMLCRICYEVFGNLQKYYNDFVQLSKLDSLLSKQMTKLDEIIKENKRFNPRPVPHNDDDDTGSPPPSQKIFDSPHPIEMEIELPSVKIEAETETRTILPRSSKRKITVKKYSSSESDDDEDYSSNGVDDNDEEDYVPPEKKIFTMTKEIADNNNEISNSTTSNSINPNDEEENNVDSNNPESIEKPDNDTVIYIPAKTERRRDRTRKLKLAKGSIESKMSLVRPVQYLEKRTKFPNPCWYCSANDFENISDCIEHTRQEHLPHIQSTSSAQICDRCAKICDNSKKLLIHKKQCDTYPSGVILPKSIQCSVCGESFARICRLNQHMVKHSQNKQFPCDLCPYAAKRPSTLALHKVNIHSLEMGNPEEPSVSCSECNKTFKNTSLLNIHKTNMHTEAGYQKYRLQQEMMKDRRTQQRRAKASPVITFCADCGIDFFARLTFLNHRKSFHGDHQGEYICETCGMDFSKVSTLKKHMQRHTNVKPWVCDQCGNTYKMKADLRKHVEQAHTEEGRLKYNAAVREWIRRKKLLASQLKSVAACPQE